MRKGDRDGEVGGEERDLRLVVDLVGAGEM